MFHGSLICVGLSFSVAVFLFLLYLDAAARATGLRASCAGVKAGGAIRIAMSACVRNRGRAAAPPRK
jgi:hypothetical protein